MGEGAAHCLAVGVEAYKIDVAEISKGFAEYDLYFLKASPSFRTESLSRKDKIDFGVKRAELRFNLKDGIAKELFPEKEEETQEKQVKYECGVSISGKGEVEFGPFKGSIVPEAKWHKITELTITTINTFCYNTGRLTKTPTWVFQPRSGENHLEAGREVGLAVQVPKGGNLQGSVKMSSRDIVLLDKNHKVPSWPKWLLNRLRGFIVHDKYYTPIEFDLGPTLNLTKVTGVVDLEAEEVLRIELSEAVIAKRRAGKKFPVSHKETLHGTGIPGYPREGHKFLKVPQLSENTRQLISKEIESA